MKININKVLSALIVSVSVSGLPVFSDTLFTSVKLGYSIYLPDNWTVSEASDSQDYFFDTTNQYSSYLSVIRYHRSSADFPTDADWTRAYFIAYTMTAEYSFDPWGAVLYYDSTQTCKIGSLWAPECYAMYYSLDTVWGSWAEYNRFTAAQGYGYNLYAAGDTLDMMQNVGLYAAIITTMELAGSTEDVGVYTPAARVRTIETSPLEYLYDPLGRRLRSASTARFTAATRACGAYISSRQKRRLTIH